MYIIIRSYFIGSWSATLLYCHCMPVGRKRNTYRIPPIHTNAPARTPNMIKMNRMLAKVEGGTVEDATPLGFNVATGDDTELGSSTFAGRADVFVLTIVLAEVSC